MKNNQPRFKAVLFDLDDTLVNTGQHILQAFNFALKRQGFEPITEKQMASVAGAPLRKCYPLFAPGGDVEKFVATHRKFQQENMHLVEKYDGVDEVLGELKKNGVKIGVVTARYRYTTNLILEKFGWQNAFDAVIAGDEVESPKPHPMPFEMAAKKIGETPENCLVVGDGCNDMLSGRTAGCKTCRALYGYGGSEPCAAKADFEISSLKQVLEIVLK